MFTYIKYIFDFKNFKKYKNTNNDSLSINDGTNTIDILTRKIEELNKNFEEKNKNSEEKLKEIFTEKVETIKELNQSQLKGLKENLDQSTKANKDLIDTKMNHFTKSLESSDEITKQLKSLFDNDKRRGTIGEQQLENILSNYLGNETLGSKENNFLWNQQYKLKNGKIVDFVVRHPSLKKLIPIDSKFPLTKIRNIWDKDEITNEELKDVSDDVKRMIKDISDKYVKNNKETVDFALMFVPSESVYNFLIFKASEVFEYGAKNNVYISSPTNILAMMSTFIIATKELENYENIKPILTKINKLADEYRKINERWEKHTKSFKTIQDSIKDLNVTFGKIESKSSSLLESKETKNLLSSDEK